jgi:hypothetical protein
MQALRDLKTHLLLTCEDSARLLSEDCDRTLSPLERAGLRLHLAVCRQCRKFRRNLRLLRRLLNEVTKPHFPEYTLLPRLTPQKQARLRRTLARVQTQEFP